MGPRLGRAVCAKVSKGRLSLVVGSSISEDGSEREEEGSERLSISDYTTISTWQSNSRYDALGDNPPSLPPFDHINCTRLIFLERAQHNMY